MRRKYLQKIHENAHYEKLYGFHIFHTQIHLPFNSLFHEFFEVPSQNFTECYKSIK